MVKMFGYFYGEVGGYSTVEEGVILNGRYGDREEGFLVQGSQVAKVEETWNKDKKILIKIPNKKKCEHNYKKRYGNSKNGAVYCNKCGDTYRWDYRTEEDMERLWAKAHYVGEAEKVKQLENKLLFLQDQIKYSKKLLVERKKRMKELGINVDDLQNVCYNKLYPIKERG